jgi:guanylate kinase
MSKGINDRIYVISAPSAGGKTTIVQRLVSLVQGLSRVITCTTRKKRDGEIHGVDYRFLSKIEFRELLLQGAFFEHSQVYGNMYGVLKSDLVVPGKKIISLDSKGVKKFKELGVEATYILIIPPTIEELKRRLLQRNSEEIKDIEIRLAEAAVEIRQANDFDYVIINDNLEKAIAECEKIIIGEPS